MTCAIPADLPTAILIGLLFIGTATLVAVQAYRAVWRRASRMIFAARLARARREMLPIEAYEAEDD